MTVDTTRLPEGCTTVPCDQCGRPVGIYPPVDGYDTRWRCGRCARRPLATRVAGEGRRHEPY